MSLITRRIELEVEVEGVKVKGQTLSTSEQTELRQNCFIDVVRQQVDEATGEPLEPKTITVFSPAMYERALWIKTVVSLSENAVSVEEGEQLEANEKDLGNIYDWNEGFCKAVAKKLSKKFLEIKSGELKNSALGVDGTLPQSAPVAKSAKKKSSKDLTTA